MVSLDRSGWEGTHTFSGGILGPTGDAARGRGGGVAASDCRADLRIALAGAGASESVVWTVALGADLSGRVLLDDTDGTAGLGRPCANLSSASNLLTFSFPPTPLHILRQPTNSGSDEEKGGERTR